MPLFKVTANGIIVSILACACSSDDSPVLGSSAGSKGGAWSAAGGRVVNAWGGGIDRGGTAGSKLSSGGAAAVSTAGTSSTSGGVAELGGANAGLPSGAGGVIGVAGAKNSQCPISLKTISFTAPPAGTSLVKLLLQAVDCNGTPVTKLASSDVQAIELVGTTTYRLSPTETRSDFYEKDKAYGLLVDLAIDFSASIYASPNAELVPSLRTSVISLAKGLLPAQAPVSQPRAVLYASAFDGLKDLAGLASNSSGSTAFFDSTGVAVAIENQLRCDVVQTTRATKLCVDGSTNLFGATTATIKAASTLPYSTSFTPDYVSRVAVVFTDGRDEANYSTLNDVRSAMTQYPNINVYAVGLRGELDEVTLTSIGKNGVFWSDSVDGLQAAFQAVTAKISDLANSFYLFQYCTAKRAGTIRLVVGSVEEMAKLAPTYNPSSTVVSQTFSANGVAASCPLTSGAGGSAGSAGTSVLAGTAGSAGGR